MRLQIEAAIRLAGESFPFTEEWSEDVWDAELDLAEKWVEPIRVSGKYWHDGQRLHVEGIITTRGHYTCTRCLDELDWQREIPFHEIYAKETARDDDALVYDGQSIDLFSLVRETLIMHVPYQVLCQEDCQGLCMHCGCNLNHGTCNCNDAEIDPRWAALAAWKNQ